MDFVECFKTAVPLSFFYFDGIRNVAAKKIRSQETPHLSHKESFKAKIKLEFLLLLQGWWWNL